MLKKVRIKIKTRQQELAGTLFDTRGAAGGKSLDTDPQEMELLYEGRYHDDGTRITISYREGELTGMENTKTTLSFQKSEPGLLRMTRDGAVRTALLFEQGRRHVSYYQTPYMPFEVAIKTKRVENRIAENGTLFLSYTAELKGANAEQTEFTMTLLPYTDAPNFK